MTAGERKHGGERSSEGATRIELVQLARSTAERGLNRGTAGNASLRTERGMLITPTAVPYGELDPEGLVHLAPDGTVRSGGTPSSEWRLHRSVYGARPEVEAVIHAHPPFSTALACLRREIPAFHYLVAAAGGDSIPCAPYAPFGSEELADRVRDALQEERQACLMANHGMMAVGDTPEAALETAVRVEWLAEVYWRTLQAGDPELLSAQEMAEIHDRLSEYGSG